MNHKADIVNSLILRIASGEVSALDALFTECGGLLFCMAKKYLQDKSRAEDMVSEVFLRVVKSAYTFKRGHNGLNWLFKIVRNLCLDENKRDKFSKKTDTLEEWHELADCIDVASEVADGVTLAQALAQLAPQERQLLYYKFWEGLTVREIAQKDKIPKSSVQIYISRALSKLGELLGK